MLRATYFCLCLVVIITVWIDVNTCANPELLLGPDAAEKRQNSTGWQSSADTVRLCLDSEPDGVALVSSGSGSGSGSAESRFLVLFKANSFWLVPLEPVTSWLASGKEMAAVCSKQNQIQSALVWPEMPANPDYVTSFNGLAESDPLSNNVLVFKNLDLFRYRVSLSGGDSPAVHVTLVARHTSAHWYRFLDFNEIMFMYIPLGSHVLVMYDQLSWLLGPAGYVMNQVNLDNPVHWDLTKFLIKSGPDLDDSRRIRFLYELSNNGSQSLLSFLSSGEVCLNGQCRMLRKLVDCEPQIDSFTDSFAYWLWRETELTLRLIMVGLVSFMAVNLALAVAFMMNQFSRILELT